MPSTTQGTIFLPSEQGNKTFRTRKQTRENPFLTTCTACQRNKTARHLKHSKLVLVGIPSRLWEQIPIDFITGVPNAKGYNQCWVIVDRFMKIAHFVMLKNPKAKELALAFVSEIWRLHGLPKRVVLDQETVFMSSFWTEVMRLMEVE